QQLPEGSTRRYSRRAPSFPTIIRRLSTPDRSGTGKRGTDSIHRPQLASPAATRPKSRWLDIQFLTDCGSGDGRRYAALERKNQILGMPLEFLEAHFLELFVFGEI